MSRRQSRRCGGAARPSRRHVLRRHMVLSTVKEMYAVLTHCTQNITAKALEQVHGGVRKVTPPPLPRIGTKNLGTNETRKKKNKKRNPNWNRAIGRSRSLGLDHVWESLVLARTHTHTHFRPFSTSLLSDKHFQSSRSMEMLHV